MLDSYQLTFFIIKLDEIPRRAMNPLFGISIFKKGVHKSLPMTIIHWFSSQWLTVNYF